MKSSSSIFNYYFAYKLQELAEDLVKETNLAALNNNENFGMVAEDITHCLRAYQRSALDTMGPYEHAYNYTPAPEVQLPARDVSLFCK